MIKSIFLIALFSIFLIHNSYAANELYEKTDSCRMEVKIIGPDALEEDENCVWLNDNKHLVIEKCPECKVLLNFIKEASLGNFDLQ